tara:strand:- start:1205 stop:1396 length:192 start_codon:yes stop_codon:yes gene_type:complete
MVPLIGEGSILTPLSQAIKRVILTKNNIVFFILNNLWLIIANITKPSKRLEVPELKEEDMQVV